MPRKVLLICNECLSRNYKSTMNKNLSKRLELKKYCKHCNKATLHKETR